MRIETEFLFFPSNILYLAYFIFLKDVCGWEAGGGYGWVVGLGQDLVWLFVRAGGEV